MVELHAPTHRLLTTANLSFSIFTSTAQRLHPVTWKRTYLQYRMQTIRNNRKICTFAQTFIFEWSSLPYPLLLLNISIASKKIKKWKMDETLTQMDSFFRDVNVAVTKSCANHHLGPRGRLTKINSLQAFFRDQYPWSLKKTNSSHENILLLSKTRKKESKWLSFPFWRVKKACNVLLWGKNNISDGPSVFITTNLSNQTG